MKNLFALAFIAIVILCSCKKSSSPQKLDSQWSTNTDGSYAGLATYIQSPGSIDFNVIANQNNGIYLHFYTTPLAGSYAIVNPQSITNSGNQCSLSINTIGGEWVCTGDSVKVTLNDYKITASFTHAMTGVPADLIISGTLIQN